MPRSSLPSHQNKENFNQGFLIGLLTLGLILFTISTTSAATISSTAAGGNWNTASTWGGGVIPGAGDDVIIVSTATVTLSASPANQTGGRTLTINGTLTLSGN